MRWETIYEVDFSAAALGNYNIKGGGNGYKAFPDGSTWLVSNVANASSWAVGPGTLGLRVHSNANSNVYDETAVTAPVVALPLRTLLSSPFPYNGLAGIRATAYLAADNIAANDDTACFAIDCISGGSSLLDPMLQRYEWSPRREGGVRGTLARLLLRGANSFAGDDVTTPNTERVFQIEVPRIGHSQALLRSAPTIDGYLSQYASMIPRGELSAAPPFVSAFDQTLMDAAVVLGLAATSGSGALQVTWQALRVEACVLS